MVLTRDWCIIDVSNGNHTYGGVYKLKIGLLSTDEIVLAGFKPSGSGVTTSNYLYYTGCDYFPSSSPTSFNFGIAKVFSGYLYVRYLTNDYVTIWMAHVRLSI